MEAHVVAGLAVGFGYVGYLAGLGTRRLIGRRQRGKPGRASRDLDRLADALLEQAVSEWVAGRLGCPCHHAELCEAALKAIGSPRTPKGHTREQQSHAAGTLYLLGVHVGRRWREFRRQEERR